MPEVRKQRYEHMDSRKGRKVMPDPSGWQRKYQWRLTWPGEADEDWAAYDGDLYIGRIHRDKTSLKAGMFIWAGGCSSWWEFERPMPQSGHEAEAWEAAKRVEDWYDEGVARAGPKPDALSQRIADLKERGRKFGW
jgi:hypothetical protein